MDTITTWVTFAELQWSRLRRWWANRWDAKLLREQITTLRETYELGAEQIQILQQGYAELETDYRELTESYRKAEDALRVVETENMRLRRRLHQINPAITGDTPVPPMHIVTSDPAEPTDGDRCPDTVLTCRARHCMDHKDAHGITGSAAQAAAKESLETQRRGHQASVPTGTYPVVTALAADMFADETAGIEPIPVAIVGAAA